MIDLKEQQKNTSLRSTLSLLALAALACVAAMNLRPGAGIWVSLPLYPVCVAIACFLPAKLWHRVTFFPLLTAVVNLGESDSPWDILPYLGMSLLCLCLVTGGVYLLRKKEWRHRLIGGGLAAVYLLVAFFALGNPFTAIAKGSKLNEYLESHYGEGTHFSQVRYDTTSGCYTVTAYSEKYPTETAEIFLLGDMIVDHYRDLAEIQITREQVRQMTDVLRKAFPGDTFAVSGVKVDNFLPEGTRYDVYQTKVSPSDMHFCVEISSESSVEKYREAVSWYQKILKAYGLEYASVTFLGGTNFYYRTAISVRAQQSFFPVVEEVSVYVRRHPMHYDFLADRQLLSLAP